LTTDRKILLLALAGLLVRAAFLLLEPANRLVADELTWTNWALEKLLEPNVGFSPFRTKMIFWPPGYPYFIAAIYAVFGSLTAVKWVQIVVSALLVPAVGRVGRTVFGERAGPTAAAIVAFYPDLIWYSVHFWCETLYLTFLWWAFERVIAADKRGRTRTALAAGLLWGMAALTRETGLYLTPLVALWLGWRAKTPGGPRRAVAFVVTAVLTIAPWTYRNWVMLRAFVPVATSGGLALYQGNSGLERQQVYEQYEAVHGGRIEQYRWARRMGLQAIADRQPFWFFEKLRDEMPRFWEADSVALIHVFDKRAYGSVSPGAALLARLAIVAPYLAVLGLFVAGVVALRLDRAAVLLLGFLVLHNLLHVATHGFARYRLPIMPVVFVVAAHAFACWRAGECPPLTPKRRALMAALVLAFALVLVPSLRAPFTDSQEPPASQAR
jgi:4-amino-4-deoxy-L-arabinose transferase-like glycosyltransferase